MHMKYFTPRNRAILREMVSTDFKVRYQGSALGYVWSLLKPLMLFAILYIVFTYIIPLGKDIAHYPVYLLTGIVLWNFFAETTLLGATSIVAKGDLIRKISIPRYLIVIASSLSALINLSLNMVVIVIFAIFNGVDFTWHWILIIPTLIQLYILALGVSFILATAYVKFRDITYIWEVVLQAGFYASAVIYPVTMVPEAFRKLFFMNPMVQIMQDAKWAIVTDSSITIWGTIHSWVAFVPIIMTFALFAIGILYFRSQAHTFAEDI